MRCPPAAAAAAGTVSLLPSQLGEEVQLPLPLHWDALPLDAAYQVGLRITPISNVRLSAVLTSEPPQPAALVYGAPLGVCPPGTSVQRQLAGAAAGGLSSDVPAFWNTAPLQVRVAI